MNWFKKLFIPSGEKTTVTAYKSWTVRWISRHGNYSHDTRNEVEIFPSEADAYRFAEQLKEAHKLLRNSSSDVVKIEVERNQSVLSLMQL